MAFSSYYRSFSLSSSSSSSSSTSPSSSSSSAPQFGFASTATNNNTSINYLFSGYNSSVFSTTAAKSSTSSSSSSSTSPPSSSSSPSIFSFPPQVGNGLLASNTATNTNNGGSGFLFSSSSDACNNIFSTTTSSASNYSLFGASTTSPNNSNPLFGPTPTTSPFFSSNVFSTSSASSVPFSGTDWGRIASNSVSAPISISFGGKMEAVKSELPGRPPIPSKEQKSQESFNLGEVHNIIDETLQKIGGFEVKKNNKVDGELPSETIHEKNINGSPRTCVSDPLEVEHSPLPMTVVSRILYGIPQNPHFLQLGCYSELARENLIMAWDRTFEETVEQIHTLRAGDFRVRASKLWKTMEELQSLGYNVLVLRKRVVDLTDVVLKQKLCQKEINGLKRKAESHRMEKSRLESVILKLEAQVQREQDMVMHILNEVADKEKDLPKLEHVFATLAGEPLQV